MFIALGKSVGTDGRRDMMRKESKSNSGRRTNSSLVKATGIE